jgi:hypothetical protein
MLGETGQACHQRLKTEHHQQRQRRAKRHGGFQHDHVEPDQQKEYRRHQQIQHQQIQHQ